MLKSFINVGNKDFDQVKWQVIIHIVFLSSALVLAASERLLNSAEKIMPESYRRT